MSLLDTASLVITPNGIKAGTLYSVVPSSGAGDMTVTRATTATRVNSDGLIESVASNVPRLDYSNGICPSILVEPQRTNLFTYSSQFDNSDWNKFESTISANSVTSPSGIQDADKLIPTTVADSHIVLQSIAGASQSFSVYAKAAEYDTIVLLFTVHNARATFDLSNGTITETSGTVTASIESVGNGWYRCIISTTLTTHTEQRIYAINGSTFADRNIAGNGTSGLYIWGAQAEAGSYATSYIPTTSASVTRNADTIYKTGISSLIGQTEGTLFVDVDFTHTNKGSNEYLAQIWVNSSSRILLYRSNVNGGIGAVIIQASSTIYSFVSTINTNERHKIAFAYKSGDIAFYIDGSSVSTSSSSFSAFSSMANYDLGIHTAGGSPLEIGDYPYKASALWTTRLTNTQLAQLTTI